MRAGEYSRLSRARLPASGSRPRAERRARGIASRARAASPRPPLPLSTPPAVANTCLQDFCRGAAAPIAMAHANWAFRQVFGDRDSQEEPADGAPSAHRLWPGRWRMAFRRCACLCLSVVLAEDLISAVQFDQTGDYMATGDRGGRVVIFESSEVTQRAAAVRRLPLSSSVRTAASPLLLARPPCPPLSSLHAIAPLPAIEPRDAPTVPGPFVHSQRRRPDCMRPADPRT